MVDANEEAEVMEFDEVAAQAGTAHTRRALEEVARARAAADNAHGFFRDYTDTDAQALQLWSTEDQTRAEIQARSGRRPWLSQLMVTVGLVALTLHPQQPFTGRTQKLRKMLVQVAELSVAWIEAIDAREAEKRVARMARPPLWTRVKAWFAALLRAKEQR